MPYTYEYPRPSVSVDCVIFGLDESHVLKVLLIQRANEPHKDRWALPGGFVEMTEGLQTAALRELEEETGMKDVFIEQLYTFGQPDRDPRGRVISVAYYALVNLEEHPVEASSDARNVQWFPIEDTPALAFDHGEILQIAINRLRAKVRYQPIGFELLPEKFTLTQLQQLYETILGVELNKRNFRKRILKTEMLRQVERQQNVPHRPAYLYAFDKAKYEQLLQERSDDIIKRGFDFEI
ncbi:MAG: NUDIX domain-containing protein [Bacteroidota bacterium]